MRPRVLVAIVVACAPLVCGATHPEASDPDAGIGLPCRYQLSGGYSGRLVCYSEQQYERGLDKAGVHLDEDPANTARVQVDFTLEEAPHFGIQAPSSVSGSAWMRLSSTEKWLATTSPDPKARKVGTFAVTVTDMRMVKVKGKDRVDLHGTVDARMMSTSSSADVELHATF